MLQCNWEKRKRGGWLLGRVLIKINVKKTTVYTHVNGDRPLNIENSKNKSYITISLHIVIRQCAAVMHAV